MRERSASSRSSASVSEKIFAPAVLACAAASWTFFLSRHRNPETNTTGSSCLDARFACERQMIDFGIRYTIHSDAGVRLCPIDKFALGLRAAERELKLTPSEILRAVTSTAAEAIGLPDRGVLQAGKRADLIVVEGDPLRDIACVEKIRAVMKAGVWYHVSTQ